MRVLAIDFGERRIGLALSDPDATLALPLTTLERRSDRQAIEEIHTLAQSEGVVELVLGEPLTGDVRHEAALRVRRFGRRLSGRTGLPVTFVDESLTSVEARRLLREAGVRGPKQRGRVDAVAAQLLLQELLDRRQRERQP